MGAVIISAGRTNGKCTEEMVRTFASHFGSRHVYNRLDTYEDIFHALDRADPLIITAIDPEKLLGLSYRGDPVTTLTFDQAVARACPGQRIADQEADFWIVWSPEGPTPPRYRHHSEASAEREAERLATEFPGAVFFVMEPRFEACAPKPKAAIVRYDRPSAEMPF